MGGPGSGRYWAQRSIEDCRCLALGELVDGGRYRRIPKGRILWRNRESARTVGRLTYRFSELIRADDGVHLPILTYTYWSAPWEGVVEDFLELRIEAGKAIVATCPR